MKAFLICFFLLTATACTKEKEIRQALPSELPGGWKLERSESLLEAQTPAVVKALGLSGAESVTYSVPGTNAKQQVLVFKMRTEASAFELIQKWRQKDGPAFYVGRYFVVAQDGAIEFQRALRQSMKATAD